LKAQSHLSASMFLRLCLLFLFCCRHHSPLFIIHHSSFTRFHQKPADHRNSLCPIKTITLSSLTGVLYCPLNNAQFKCSELLFSTIVTNYLARCIYPPSATDWIQTHDLGMTSQVFYHRSLQYNVSLKQ
jgi:hypothetical protein